MTSTTLSAEAAARRHAFLFRQGLDPRGLALIEDLGSQTFTRLFSDGHDDRPLYELAVNARRDLADGLEDQLVDHYLRCRPDMDRERFLAEYWLLAAHRHTKILGNFERLSKRDGKHGYLDFNSRVQEQLLRAPPKAGLTRISALMARVLPGWESHVPTLPPEAIEQKKANVA